MPTMSLCDGSPLPEPLSHEHHVCSFYKSSEGRQVTISVQEIIYPTLQSLAVVKQTEGWEQLTTEYLTGIIARRLGEGWTLQSASERHAVLSRLASMNHELSGATLKPAGIDSAIDCLPIVGARVRVTDGPRHVGREGEVRSIVRGFYRVQLDRAYSNEKPPCQPFRANQLAVLSFPDQP